MSKEFTREEREKWAQELIADDFDLDLLGGVKKPRKSLKTPIEKVQNYHLLVESSVFWASRQAYLEMVQSFLSKKIDGETFTSKFCQLRGKDMRRNDELYLIIEDRILPIPDLYYTFKAEEFSSAINELFLEIDRSLKKNGTSLREQDHKKYLTLLNCSVKLSNHIHWENKKDYLTIMENLVNLTNSIDQLKNHLTY